MKKRIYVFILALAMPIASIFSQMSYDHWSIQLKGGLNSAKGFYPIGDPWNRDVNGEFGGAVEYTFSPLVGIGLEYLNLNNDHQALGFTSQVHEGTIFGSLNVSNMTVQFRKGFWKNFNTYVNAGTGFAFGEYKTKANIEGDVLCLHAHFGMNFEYNISNDFAVGLEPQYRWHTNSRFNPVPFQVNNKDFYTINLNFRYKIIGSKMHIRNQNYVDYQLDQIANYQHQQKQEGGIGDGSTKMQQLLQEQAKKQAFVKDSLLKDSLKTDSINKATELIKPKATSNDYFMKMGQNVGKQTWVDPADSIKGTQVDKTSNYPYNGDNQSKETAKNPMIEPIIEGGDIATSSGKPVSMKTEAYQNTPLKRYSVVVGSFGNKENADSFTDKLKGLGYEVIVVQNEQGLYRIITHTTNSIDNAVQQVKKMRSKYADSWILVLK